MRRKVPAILEALQIFVSKRMKAVAKKQMNDPPKDLKEAIARCCDLCEVLCSLMVGFIIARPEDAQELIDTIHALQAQSKFLAEDVRKLP